ncbi:MAG: response regulator transcription factor [Gloeobacteraceae cyanobacterium ES-bin-316]|nr:response regulator transcription factor [Ferruginibacter sp.]
MTCIIVDDEPLARQGMELLMGQIPSIQICGSFGSAIDANYFLQKEKVDIIFMDINMPDLNGLDYIKSLLVRPMVIFVTAYPQYALDSYELDAIDYLVKPVRFERLLKAINKAENYQKLLKPDEAINQVDSIEEDFIFIKSERKYFKIFFREILFIEGLKDYVIIQMADKKILTAMNIKTIAARLPQSVFARISKSFIVNITHIISFDTFTIYLKNEELPMGNNYKDDFFENCVNGKLIKR